MENQQQDILSTNQKQVLLTGFYGDGGIYQNGNGNYYYKTSSINKTLLELKSFLLGDLKSTNIKTKVNKGSYKKGASINEIISKTDKRITDFIQKPVQDLLEDFTELGIALWIYDDGSLHKDNYFYNICTHKYSKEYQEKYLLPLLEKFGIYGQLTVENKKDGRKFFYIRVRKHDGAFNISEILRKYPVEGMEYKMWCSETSQEWRKLQAELKSDGRVLSKRSFTNEINKRLSKI